MFLRKYPLRFAVVCIFLFAGFAYSIGFLIYIQIFRSSYLSTLARRQHEHSIVLEPRRGTIYDRNMRPLAISLPVYSIYANPKIMRRPHDVDLAVEKLSAVLKTDPKFIREKLGKNKYFVWIRRKVPQEVYLQVSNLKLTGIGFIKESQRYYPNQELAAHVIGFTGIDNKGLAGLELDYDKYLEGKPGRAIILRDARSRELMFDKGYVPPQDGLNIVLTIDETIQFIAERALDEMYKKYHCKGASIIVMNPKTGAILALANRPTYNLQEASKSTPESRTDRAVVYTYEPGSVFKIVTASAALQEGVVREGDVINCEHGAWHVAGRVLHDAEKFGMLTFRQVIEQSSNIGTTKVAMRLGPQRVYNYAHRFRFGMRTGIDLPGEAPGILKPVREWSGTSITAVPIGQEVTVTPIQLVCAMSAIAENGAYMRPFVVKYIEDSEGHILYEHTPQILDKVITQTTARRVKAILEGVVKEGTGTKAAIAGVVVAGKTGTAQKVVKGAYSHSHFYATFDGFAPANDPRLAAVVVFDDPHPAYYGGTVAAPVFSEVVGDSLKYLASRTSGD
ncbi:MAG: penicillin-binding protein [Candidatus Omnitrophica bacterium]|nr:penicillin-binding protein [Candidatus Omnitrophota bacterium]MDE2231513.1 penicillin-binding protein [Candidatus Omnitrophota bacterium]